MFSVESVRKIGDGKSGTYERVEQVERAPSPADCRGGREVSRALTLRLGVGYDQLQNVAEEMAELQW